MAYEKTLWENNKTKLNAANMNKIENGIETNSNNLEEMKKKINLYAEDGTLIGYIHAYSNNTIAIRIGNGSGENLETEYTFPLNILNSGGLNVFSMSALERIYESNKITFQVPHKAKYASILQQDDSDGTLVLRVGAEWSSSITDYKFPLYPQSGTTEINVLDSLQSAGDMKVITFLEDTFASWINAGTLTITSFGYDQWESIIQDTSNKGYMLCDQVKEYIWITSRNSKTISGFYIHNNKFYSLDVDWDAGTIKLTAITGA